MKARTTPRCTVCRCFVRQGTDKCRTHAAVQAPCWIIQAVGMDRIGGEDVPAPKLERAVLPARVRPEPIKASFWDRHTNRLLASAFVLGVVGWAAHLGMLG